MMAQKTWFGERMCLLSVQALQSTLRGSKSPKTALVGKSQPKRKRPKLLDNFVNKRNTPIVVMNHYREVRYALSESIVSFPPKRHLAEIW